MAPPVPRKLLIHALTYFSPLHIFLIAQEVFTTSFTFVFTIPLKQLPRYLNKVSTSIIPPFTPFSNWGATHSGPNIIDIFSSKVLSAFYFSRVPIQFLFLCYEVVKRTQRSAPCRLKTTVCSKTSLYVFCLFLPTYCHRLLISLCPCRH